MDAMRRPPALQRRLPMARAAAGAIYRCARSRAAVKWCTVACRECRMPALLGRPGDRTITIGRAIGRGVQELVAVGVEMAGYCALGGRPVVFSI